MPYYCTVPQCTSMSGKIENVSFHRFPRDKELAELWNKILKRGKPYTKYSKVCSLHFKPEDYVAGNGNQERRTWRTLKKEAVPSMNLPSISIPNSTLNVLNEPLLDPQLQQRVAHTIYSQTMLAVQSAVKPINTSKSDTSSSSDEEAPFNLTVDNKKNQEAMDKVTHTNDIVTKKRIENSLLPVDNTYSCAECSKYYKDFDVFLLHKRTHKHKDQKENQISRDDMVKSNPILANQLASPHDKNILNEMMCSKNENQTEK